MINIDFLTLKAFFIENIDFFIGARLQKIQQPTRRDFIFSLRNYSESKKLYVNISPQIYHICFMSSENENKRALNIPKHPPMFCMLLRKYLEGCKISDAKVIDNERIIEFHFEITDEFSQKRSLCLCVELMGKHSNLILYDRNTKNILGCAHNVGSEKSRYRELQGGLTYIYPPKNNHNLEYGVNLSEELKIQFSGLTQEQVYNYLKAEEFRPAILEERYTLFQELIKGSYMQNSVNDMIDGYYSNVQEAQKLESEKNRLLNIVNPKLKKATNSIQKISSLLKKRDNADKYKLYGELLTANLYQKKDYLSEIELFDYVNNKNVVIELDSTKTLNENAQRYFKLYTKSKTTREKSEKMLSELQMEKEYFESLIYSIESSENLNELEDISSEIGKDNNVEKIQKKQVSAEIMNLNISDFTVYVGRNNKQNDYIVSKLAKDEDFWFHTRQCAGSHVLLKTNGREVDDKTLFECCKLAAKYSSASMSSKIGVIYTRAKNLKKPPASPLGYVTYKNEKEILVST